MTGILHTLNKAPSHTDLLRSLLDVVEPGDTILLIENGVYCAYHEAMQEAFEGVKVFVLDADAHARGIYPAEGFELASYSDFVDMCTAHQKVINWY